MPKPKKQTPQEIYQEKKAREEAERTALLPPGLVNHGNTCFMNSTLQGLLATRFLDELVHFQPLPASAQTFSSLPVASWRSPLLTNGHGIAGEYEKPWEGGMPLGDTFLQIMLRAWTVQAHKKRQSMSPRDVLSQIGSKYDQYLDFAQQDAHEFLRQLLDAIRMEELDVIKKRQPPPPKEKRKPHHKSPPTSHSRPNSPSSRPPAFRSNLSTVREASTDGTTLLLSSSELQTGEELKDDKLLTFPDMLFGGQFASILVCEKCKKVSITLEDFNDISLSIRPEDYARPKTKDKLKSFAKKLKLQRSSGRSDSPTLPAESPRLLEVVRSASVPPSPIRRSSDVAAKDAEDDGPLLIHNEPRRRSIDAVTATNVRSGLKNVLAEAKQDPQAQVVNGSAVEDPDGDTAVAPAAEEEGDEPLRGRVGFADQEKPDKEKKGKDNWTKFSRRISIAMGRKDGTSSRSKERGRSRSSVDLAHEAKPVREVQKETASQHSTDTVVASGSIGAPSIKSADGSTLIEESVPALTSVASPTAGLFQPRPMLPRTPSALSNLSNANSNISNPRVKSPRPPKPTREEAAYLQALLADVSGPSNNPFAAFLSGAGDGASKGQALWAKIAQLTTVDECLRMFTAVEVLDGENMVGCRRCWKIANGVYRYRTDRAASDVDITGEDGDDSDEPKEEVDPAASPGIDKLSTQHPLSSPLSSDISTLNGSLPSLAATNGDSHSLSTSVSSLVSDTDGPSPSSNGTPLGSEPPYSFQGLPIPLISTTAPESPLAPRVGDTDALRTPIPRTVASSRSALLTPGSRMGYIDPGSDAEDSGTESDTSVSSWAASEASSAVGSPVVSPRNSREHLPKPPLDRLLSATPPRSLSPLKAVPRSQQKIMRRALKRYLIQTPPPVLVVHLKRFQQIDKVPTLSFSGSSFKKLEDYVAFPELLDLAPYLAPRKEDYGIGPNATNKKGRFHRKKEEKCMYRLYAVVEHIGNMLGGHYVAYTALPSGHAHTSPTTTPSSEAPSTFPTSSPSKSSAAAEAPTSDSESTKPRQWAYISDTIVRLTTLEEVLKAKAYMCMYERI